MKHTIAFITCLCIAFMVAAFSQEVVSPAGTDHKNGNGSISWTMGEAIIETLITNQYQLTQGFQQPKVTVSTFVEDLQHALHIKAYPNPTRDHVILAIEHGFEDSMYYELLGMNGNMLQRQDIESSQTLIRFSDLTPGSYFIRVLNRGSAMKTFVIVKQ